MGTGILEVTEPSGETLPKDTVGIRSFGTSRFTDNSYHYVLK